jgi:mono/diheme cytochrome c family protein
MAGNWKRLKTGEKVLFSLVGVLGVVTVVNYAVLEWIRQSSHQQMFPIRTHYDFVGEGFHGSELFRKNNCSSCHRAIGNGTNMGLDLDGIGSRRDLPYLIAFLRDPEATYGTRTVEHGRAPKDAAYVSELPEDDRHAIAVFLSQLKADRGGAAAKLPPPGKSGFIDAMVDMWVPDSWRVMFSDVRAADSAPQATPPGPADGTRGKGNGN